MEEEEKKREEKGRRTLLLFADLCSAWGGDLLCAVGA